ncbi:hypothetical protein [Paraburkholderia sejongensis]|uniref:hypothetical protein n=1 Tax=Paraburkholderia sejongensis TaxID=2886946 RepID=UPI002E79BB92|nr:hypothetical protein [Paraburkholderia sp. MMS20-SJTR3]
MSASVSTSFSTAWRTQLRTLATAAQALDGTPYAWRYANSRGAATLVEAQRAGSIAPAPAGDPPVLAAAVGAPSLQSVADRAYRAYRTYRDAIRPRHIDMRAIPEPHLANA